MKPPPNQVKRRLAWPAALLLCLAAAARAEPRVLIVSIDGLRPDVALRADMPVLRSLMKAGSFTFWATTTPAAITLPSHTSMLTGVTIERHGIKGNDDDAAAKQPIRVPTIFDLAHDAGLSTAMVSGKSKFLIFARPVDAYWMPTASKSFKRSRAGSTKPTLKAETAEDDVVGDRTVDLIEQHKPRLLFVHFAMNDFIGHANGWGTLTQLANLAVTDAALGRIVDALKAAGVYDETTMIVTADHGGSGRQHGKDDDASKFIPWVIIGPGVRENLDLSLFRRRPVRTYDTFATACSVLGLSIPPDIDGRPVTQAFEATELLQTRVPATQAETPTTAPAKRPPAGESRP